MKINLGKLFKVLGHVVVAIPTIAEAVKPILHEVNGSKAHPLAEPQPPGDGAGAISHPPL